MAKPSKTNIQPPATPPQTTWDLQGEGYSAFYASKVDDLTTPGVDESAVFSNLVATINLANTGFVVDDLNEYDYVFFGTNGGYDETVYGRSDGAGIIVTGNGKDQIHGNIWDDLIFAGNGADKVWGGGGDDVIFGENGPDELYGQADNDTIYGGNGPDTIVGGTDNGTFSVSGGGGEIAVNDGVFAWATNPNGTQAAGTGNANNENLQHDGIYVDGTTVYQVFSFEPKDRAPAGLDNIKVTVAIFDDGFVYTGNFVEMTMAEDKNNYFTVELGSSGGKVAVFLGWVSDGDLTLADLTSPNADPNKALKDVGLGVLEDFVTIEDGETEVSFEAGDVLTGGNHGATPDASDGAPDTFKYAKGDGVDLINDFELANADTGFAGDKLVLSGFDESNDDDGDTDFDLDDLKAIEDVDGNLVVGFSDGSGGWLDNSAIKFEGYSLSDFDVLKTQIEIQSA